jgi:hypothetical protein
MKKMYVTVIMFATFSGLIKLSKMVMYMQRMGPLKEKEKRLRMLSDQKRRVENVNILIDLHMKKFEYFRLVESIQGDCAFTCILLCKGIGVFFITLFIDSKS